MRDGPMKACFNDAGQLVLLWIVQDTACDLAPDMLEKELVRIFQEHGQFKAENAKLKGQALIVKRGDFPMMEFEVKLSFGNEIETLEQAYSIGWSCGVLECGEILSGKPITLPE